MPSARILRLREKAAALPLCPGVYLMKDADGTVIYVGKSRHLKNRVSSYFVDTDHGPKTARMVARVEDFDTILCDTEMEALTLENTLIKRYSPRYNIKLKDAKSYPYLKITAEAWPRVVVTRRRVSDGGSYFGPYRSSATAYSALETVSSIFGLPTCRRVFPRDIGRDRPCLYRQMGHCCAPCVPDIDREAYLTLIASAKNVLRGHTREAETELRRRMEAASDELLFELAAHYRDSIAALSRLGEKQKVVSDERAERDVFALWEGPVSGALAVLQVREGKLLYKNEYAYTASELTDGADLAGLLLDYYGDGADVPREILLDREIEAEDREALEELLAGSCGHRVEVRTPKRGDARKLVEMAAENARHHAETKKEGGENRERTLARLAALLGLEVLPARIEAYDISNLGREFATCSMVVWEDGAPKRGDYRTFRIRTTDGQDDYGAMREALSRRLDHIGEGSPSLGVCPDLILLD
ncbi:MAG: excinuclease ABC subunit UvrC, partial [Clostridia bacterium]|nr:excinuclease ABC subunit UvrC [Clostridia bacterium]